MSYAPIERWHFVIPGLTQSEGKPDGWSLLWRELNHLSTDTCCVEFKTWHSRWSDIAEVVSLFRGSSLPTVKVYGYSFGGYSAVLLARQLMRRGIPVHTLLLCDAVLRYPFVLGDWRSMAPGTITIPKNVRNVYSYRQTHPRFSFHRNGGEWTGWKRWPQPAGHDLVAECPIHTYMHEPLILDAEHVWMDDQPEVHAKAQQIAKAA